MLRGGGVELRRRHWCEGRTLSGRARARPGHARVSGTRAPALSTPGGAATAAAAFPSAGLFDCSDSEPCLLAVRARVRGARGVSTSTVVGNEDRS